MLSKELIYQIVQELDCGLECYVNLTTQEIISIPNQRQFGGDIDAEEGFEEQFKQIERQEKDLLHIEPLESFESFKIMERFAAQVDNAFFKARLEEILGNRKPFQNFKYAIDNSDFRQDWFSFKQAEQERIIEHRIQVALKWRSEEEE